MSGGKGAEPDRSRPPIPGGIRPFDFPEVDAEALENGLELRVARMPRLPVVTFSLVVPAGESALTEERAGLAVLTGDALEGGTGTRDGIRLAEALEGIGTELRVSTGWDATTVTLSCLAEQKEEAVALLGEVVLDPSFPEDEVQRVRDQALARVRQRAMNPSTRAHDEAVRFLYADGMPYGRPLAGTERSVVAVERDGVRGFHEARYRPRDGGLVVVGDVDPEEVRRLADVCFGDWDGVSPVRAEVEALPRSRAREIHVVDRPGSVQSEIRIGHPGVPKSSPDYFALVVANTVLGGAFTSRLNLNLRERHGFTYGVRSRFSFRRGAGPFLVSTAVGTEVTAPAVREAVDELERLVADGLTEDEVTAARDYIAGVFPLRLETTGQVAARIAELLVYGLPNDWHARYRERIRGIDPETAEAAARRHIRPGEAQIVVLGDADAVAPELEALEVGPVRIHGSPAAG